MIRRRPSRQWGGLLAALRLHPELSAGATLPAAGLPWFMALFGRDSLIISLQNAIVHPQFALGALKAAEWIAGKKGFHEFGETFE